MFCDKIVFDVQSADFTITSSSTGTPTKVGNTVEITGYTAPVTLTLQYTVAATYNNRVKTILTTDTPALDSAWSTVDSIVIGSGVVVQNEFYTALYEGTGATQTINVPSSVISTGLDFVWGKDRDATNQHFLFDSIRGANNRLLPNLTNAEDVTANVTAFNASGFDLGSHATANSSATGASGAS